VLQIADRVIEAMELSNITVRTTGGRAWPGDVRTMQVDVSKSKSKGGVQGTIATKLSGQLCMNCFAN